MSGQFTNHSMDHEPRRTNSRTDTWRRNVATSSPTMCLSAVNYHSHFIVGYPVPYFIISLGLVSRGRLVSVKPPETVVSRSCIY